MQSISRFLFFAFVVCCICKNQVGYSGSYTVKTSSSEVNTSAFTVSKDQVKKILKKDDFDAYSDFAAFQVSTGDMVLTTDGMDPYLFETMGDFYKGTFDEDNENTLLFNNNAYAMTFYPYKGQIRKSFALTYLTTTMESEAEKVSKEDFLKELDYTMSAPNYATYTEYFIVRFTDGIVGVLTNKSEGVIDVSRQAKSDNFPNYHPCRWVEKHAPEDPDKIDCSGFTIEFSGDVISGVSATVVSCLVLIICSLVFTLL